MADPQRRTGPSHARPRRFRGAWLIAAVVVVLGAAGFVYARYGSPASSPPTSSTSTTVAEPAALCPLTGTPAPGGVVPQRPALAMKIDNYSLGPAPAEARPQSGLDYADVIFEEQVEGAITRYAAVFQCRNAPGLVGPIRSARWTDVQVLSQLGRPIFVHVGGIVPVIDYIDSSSLVNLDLGANGQLETHPAGRVAPYDTYASTAAVWAAAKQPATAPAPIFTFSTTAPAGEAVSQVHLDWSGTSDIYWRWDAATGTWLRFYNVGDQSTPDIQADVLADGVQNQAQNVIVQDVDITYGPWVENSAGGLEAESHIIGASGRADVFRNGRMIVGTWSVARADDPARFVDAAGQTIALAPGRTWVEIYPDTAPFAVTPVTAATTTTAPTTSTSR